MYKFKTNQTLVVYFYGSMCNSVKRRYLLALGYPRAPNRRGCRIPKQKKFIFNTCDIYKR